MNGGMPAQDLVERALEASKVDECVVVVDEDSAVHLRWAGNEPTANGAAATRQITVIAAAHGATGVGVGTISHRGDLDDVAPLVAAAEDAARDAPPAPDAQPLIATVESADSWTAPVPEASVAVLGGLAVTLAEVFSAARATGLDLYGFAEHRARSTFLGSSAGIRLRHDHRAGHVELTGRYADGAAWAGVPSRDFTDVSVPDLVGGIRRNLASAQRRVELPPGRYECLLAPAAVADLMTHLYWAAGAREAAEGRSVFRAPGGGTRVGEQLTAAPLTLRGDPAAPGLECAPFLVARASDETVSVFDNGVPLAATRWLDNGKLAALRQTRHDARTNGLPLTPHIDNLILEAPDPDGELADLVAASERCLLVTSLWYIREVDPANLLLTGLTRDGVYLVEHGEIVGAVNNFRFNESPVDMLSRVSAIGSTAPARPREWADAFSHIAMPALRVADFHMSSASRAT